MADYPDGFRIHILYEFVDGPWGGANQFLKALRKAWREEDIYAERPAEADAILFESFDSLPEVVETKLQHPKTVFVHRIDGPTSMVRGFGRSADRRVFTANRIIADGTVFQSDWCRGRNFELGLERTPYTTTVLNAPDPDLFNPSGSRSTLKEPIKLIGTSWSGNFNKGFDVYQFLDEALNHERFDFTFVGNSPVEFRHIDHVEPVPTPEVARLLKEHDIFITASRNDPCSNSLIEALHCGLPAVARNDGGHPEIVGDGGELFTGTGDVLEKVHAVVADYEQYRRAIELPDIDQSAEAYGSFVARIVREAESGDYTPKPLSTRDAVRTNRRLSYLTAQNRLENLAGRARNWFRHTLRRRQAG